MASDDKKAAQDSKPSARLTRPEQQAVREAQSSSARVVHEAVRLGGVDEMERPALSLAISGVAAGLAISSSVMAKAAIQAELGESGIGALVGALGYAVGFLVVILGRMQLFTENTVVPVLVFAHSPTWRNAGLLLRLWAIVLAANLVGAFAAAAAIEAGWLSDAQGREDMLVLSRHALEPGALAILTRGIPAGFLIGAVAWILPTTKGNEFWVVLALTAAISVGGFTHVVAGAVEGFLLLLAGELAASALLTGFLLPALLGNVVGGTLLFALLAHGQVSRELA
jgi:formate/nitrite transporter FocA (FNT family)